MKITEIIQTGIKNYLEKNKHKKDNTYSDKIRKASSLSTGFSKISPFIAMTVSALIITAGGIYRESHTSTNVTRTIKPNNN